MFITVSRTGRLARLSLAPTSCARLVYFQFRILLPLTANLHYFRLHRFSLALRLRCARIIPLLLLLRFAEFESTLKLTASGLQFLGVGIPRRVDAVSANSYFRNFAHLHRFCLVDAQLSISYPFQTIYLNRCRCRITKRCYIFNQVSAATPPRDALEVTRIVAVAVPQFGATSHAINNFYLNSLALFICMIFTLDPFAFSVLLVLYSTMTMRFLYKFLHKNVATSKPSFFNLKYSWSRIDESSPKLYLVKTITAYIYTIREIIWTTRIPLRFLKVENFTPWLFFQLQHFSIVEYVTLCWASSLCRIEKVHEHPSNSKITPAV